MCCVVGGLCDLPRGTGVTIKWELESASGVPENFADYVAVHVVLLVGSNRVGFYSSTAHPDKDGDVEAVSGEPTQCQIHVDQGLTVFYPLGLLECEMMRIYNDSNFTDNDRPVITKLQLRNVTDSEIGNLIWGE